MRLRFEAISCQYEFIGRAVHCYTIATQYLPNILLKGVLIPNWLNNPLDFPYLTNLDFLLLETANHILREALIKDFKKTSKYFLSCIFNQTIRTVIITEE